MRAIIIDDETRAVKSIELALNQYCPDVTVVGKAYNAKDGIIEISDKKPDIVFLDIEMPFTTGIELLESSPNREFDVIFVTGYAEYAIKAFKLNAIDYLLKPLNVLELIEAIKRVKENSKNYHVSHQKIDQLSRVFLDKFPVSSMKGTDYIKLREISHFQADGSYSKIHTLNNKTYTISKNLKEVEEQLNSTMFFRVHKSYLINLEHIKKLSPSKDGGTVMMSNDAVLEIARSRKALFLELLNKLS